MVHYYPEADAATTPTPDPTPDFDARADLVAGRYRFNRMSYTTAEKLTGLFSSAKFSVMDDGTLLIGGLNLRFVEVAPFVFRQVNGEDTLIFRQDEQGTVTHAFISSIPCMAVERVPELDTPLLHYALLGISVLGIVSKLKNRTFTV